MHVVHQRQVVGRLHDTQHELPGEVQEIVGGVVEGLSCLDELMVAEGVIEKHRAVVRARLSSLLTSDRELDLDRP
jgi:hypothetical protein